MPVFAAEVKHTVDEKQLQFQLEFSKGYSNVNTLKLEKSLVVSFETAEEIKFDKVFWDMPVKGATITSDGGRKRLIVDFASEVIAPEIVSKPNILNITFPIANAKPATPEVGRASYAKMLWGLLIILAVILVLFWLMKMFFKKQIFSDIPGSGRLLGKADLDIRKNLYFYEVDEKIYIIGVTDASMNLIDKIDDEDSVSRIKAGFSKKDDFASYMKYFKKHPSVKDEVEISRESITERLESLKKR
jgi:flagellar biogenesis protein FliO